MDTGVRYRFVVEPGADFGEYVDCNTLDLN